jgi:hypothetical protein
MEVSAAAGLVTVVVVSSSSVSSSVSGFSKRTDRVRPVTPELAVLVRELDRIKLAYSGEVTSCSIVAEPSNGAIHVDS